MIPSWIASSLAISGLASRARTVPAVSLSLKLSAIFKAFSHNGRASSGLPERSSAVAS